MADTRAVQTWAGLSDEAFDAVEAQIGSFADNVRNVAIMPASVIAAATQAARVPTPEIAATATAPLIPAADRLLTPMEVAQFGLIWRVARRIMAPDWDTYTDVDPFAPPAPPTPPAQPQVIVQAPAAPAVAPVAKVKLSTMLDQHDDAEATVASEAQIVKWNENWVKFAQGPPLEEEDPTIQQLSALNHRTVVLGGAPYADFAVFTPFNRLVARANKFVAQIPQTDGSWVTKEIPGPQNFEAWGFCWKVFRCSCIQLDIVREAALSRHYQNIEGLVRDWPECWAIIYQAEDKSRAEDLAKRKRAIEARIAGGAPAPPLWDANAPWSACFIDLAADSAYWDRHVRHLAVSWLSRGRKGELRTREQTITENAITGGHHAQAELHRNTEPPAGRVSPHGQGTTRAAIAKRRLREAAAATTGAHTPPPPPKRPNNGKGGKDKGKGKGKGGKHKTSTDGKQICFNWNSNIAPCAGQRTCPNGRAHVCQICLSSEHTTRDHPSR